MKIAVSAKEESDSTCSALTLVSVLSGVLRGGCFAHERKPAKLRFSF
jgi:hypothetical protein